jgi:L-threonylcarbamoyladenylate synthase
VTRPTVLPVDAERPDARALEQAAAVLRCGGLVAFPTETVYGLGADALSADAVRRAFAAKGRPADDPMIVHVDRVGGLFEVAETVPPVAAQLAAAFWPGPLTVVVPRGQRVPPEVTAGLDSVAVRCPSHPVALALLGAFGGPIAAPSANAFGRPSPTTADHVVTDLGERIDLGLDGGPCPVGIESTVVDCRSDPPQLLRPGAISLEALAHWSVTARTVDGPARSPGLMPGHYAPLARLVVAQADKEDADVAGAIGAAAALLADRQRNVHVLLADEDLAGLGASGPGVTVHLLGSRADVAAVARQLYGALRSADAAGAEVILARDFGRAMLAAAIRDRLTRAAHGRVVLVGDDASEAAARMVHQAEADHGA